jgi:uncharacterized protein (TIGR00369 family)
MSLRRPSDPDFETKIRDSFSRQQLMPFLGAEITQILPGHVEVQVGYRPELTQQHGYFHAGVVGAIADTAGGYAAFSLMPKGSSVLTVEYKINLVAPADGERLIARGQVEKAGRTLTVCRLEVEVLKDGHKKTCALGQQTIITLRDTADG